MSVQLVAPLELRKMPLCAVPAYNGADAPTGKDSELMGLLEIPEFVRFHAVPPLVLLTTPCLVPTRTIPGEPGAIATDAAGWKPNVSMWLQLAPPSVVLKTPLEVVP